MAAFKKQRLGELLIQNNVITEQQLNEALEEQKKTGEKIGETLVRLHYVDQHTLLNFLSKQLKVPLIDLRLFRVKAELVRKIPEAYARRFQAILLEESNEGILIGTPDPQNIIAYDELTQLLKRPIKFALVSQNDLPSLFDSLYRRTEAMETYAKELSAELTPTAEVDLAEEVTESAVAKLLQTIFEDAVQIRASDIHIEPGDNLLRIRMRVDGVLQEHIMNGTRVAPALTQRLKLMARLNITEHRLPQDGRFTMKIKNKVIDIRLSTLPMQFGESMVMRLLHRADALMTFDQLGMPGGLTKAVKHVIQLPYGMILFTGPTGSGKSTTMYTILNEINEPGKKIITAEDPVEYFLPRINQVQVNPYVDLDFARILRASLRQDPDVIMLGEIRDRETSNIALRAAITGHLVLATLHTNDAISSAARLMDMGNEGFVIAAALRAVISQRLVRRICPSCKSEHVPTPEEMGWVKIMVKKYNLDLKLDDLKFQQGKGCTQCNGTGYKGRIGVYEFLLLNAEMIASIAQNDTVNFLKIAKADPNYIPLEKAAFNLAKENVTTLAEALRISLEIEEMPTE